MKKISYEAESIKYLFWSLLNEIFCAIFRKPNHFCSVRAFNAMIDRDRCVNLYITELEKEVELKKAK